MLGRAALQEQHGVVVRHRHQRAQVRLGLRGHRDESLAAMGLLHHRGAGLPFQSSSSRWARSSTASGIAAGPALKFQTLLTCAYIPRRRVVTRIMARRSKGRSTGRCGEPSSEADQQHQRDAQGQHRGGDDQPPHLAARAGRLLGQMRRRRRRQATIPAPAPSRAHRPRSDAWPGRSGRPAAAPASRHVDPVDAQRMARATAWTCSSMQLPSRQNNRKATQSRPAATPAGHRRRPKLELSRSGKTRPDSGPDTARKATVQRPAAGTSSGVALAGSSSARSSMRQSPTLSTSPGAQQCAFAHRPCVDVDAIGSRQHLAAPSRGGPAGCEMMGGSLVAASTRSLSGALPMRSCACVPVEILAGRIGKFDAHG